MISMVSRAVLESSILSWLKISTKYLRTRIFWVQMSWRNRKPKKIKRPLKEAKRIRKKKRKLQPNLPKRNLRVNPNWYSQIRTKVLRRISVNLHSQVLFRVNMPLTRSHSKQARSRTVHPETWIATSIWVQNHKVGPNLRAQEGLRCG